jgi:hypothetical protein
MLRKTTTMLRGKRDCIEKNNTTPRERRSIKRKKELH